jgi:hypothetical protein
VPLALATDVAPQEGGAARNQGTKASLRAVLDLLAGGRVRKDLGYGIAKADQLDAATPGDLLVVYTASHGCLDLEERFYVAPSDVGDATGPAGPG